MTSWAMCAWPAVPRKPPPSMRAGDMADAKLLSNMAASQLALDKFVAAAMYGQKCVEADPDWWKGHWYRGQALMKMCVRSHSHMPGTSTP